MAFSIILFIAGVFVGGLCGIAISSGENKRKRVGKLRADGSTGSVYLFMEINVPVEQILAQEQILLDVDLTPLTRE